MYYRQIHGHSNTFFDPSYVYACEKCNKGFTTDVSVLEHWAREHLEPQVETAIVRGETLYKFVDRDQMIQYTYCMFAYLKPNQPTPQLRWTGAGWYKLTQIPVSVKSRHCKTNPSGRRIVMQQFMVNVNVIVDDMRESFRETLELANDLHDFVSRQ